MTLKKLTEEKKQKIYDLCIKRFEKAKPTIRFVAQVIGNIVASSPPVPLRILSYRALKKQTRLQDSKGTGRTNAKIELSNEACIELVWWKHNIKNSFQDLVIPKLDITIFTDASETGWDITDAHNSSRGQLVEHERMHINVLEHEADFGIHTYCQNRSCKHIRVMSDSSTAIGYINNKGGIEFKKCNETAKKYGYDVLKIILSSLQLTYLENTISRQISFLENLTIIQNVNLILRYLLKLLISLTSQN